MYEVKQVTSDAGQTQSLVLPDGTTVTITMVFVPMQYGWFFSNITYGSFVLENIRICNSPNLLHQWRNQVPFGIACFSLNQREPSQQQDFSSGASKLYILSASEVTQYAEYLSA